MKIKAGEQEIQVKGIYGAPARHEGVLVDSFKVALPGDISEEQLEAMLQNPWEIFDDNGAFQSVQEGISAISEYSLTFLKVTEKDKLQILLQKAQEEAVLYMAALKDAGLDPQSELMAAVAKGAGTQL